MKALVEFGRQPNPIPHMQGGMVVPTFDISITHCGYCGRELSWNAERRGHKTWEAYEREREEFKKPYQFWPILAWGPPSVVFTYGCPKYGKSSEPGIWHYHWWSENFIMEK